MPRKPVLCAGTCGQYIHVGKGSLPEGQATCHECRRVRRGLVTLDALTCVVCGAKFPFALGRRHMPRKLCDDSECRREFQRRRMAELSASEHPCPDCGTPSGGPTNACCAACRERRKRDSQARGNAKRPARVARAQHLATQACERCGGPLPRARRKYCSEACGKPTGAATLRECIICRNLFVVKCGRRTCSDDCAAESKRRNDREYNRRRLRSRWDRSERQCGDCGAGFIPGHVRQRYCDDRCQSRAGRRRERAAGGRSPDHRARARKLGRRYEQISPVEIFERDGWRCQIPECAMRSRKVKRAARVPDPKAPTLDHIIPMALPGGDHVKANVQCAHFLCNSRKREVVGDVQLALFG